MRANVVDLSSGNRVRGAERFLVYLVCLLITFSLTGFSVPNPRQSALVDQTGRMDDTVQESLTRWNAALQQSGAQIALAVVPTLDGTDIESAATDTFRSWGVGDAKKNNGVLILIALEDRAIRVEVGYGVEDVLPDGLVGRLLRQLVYPAFQKSRYSEGAVALIDAIGQKLGEKYGVQAAAVSNGWIGPNGRNVWRIGVFPLFLLLLIFLRGKGVRMSGMNWVLLSVLQSIFRDGGGRGGRGGFGGGGFGGSGGGGGFGGGSSGGGGASGNW